jgi:hypothetical protein
MIKEAKDMSDDVNEIFNEKHNQVNDFLKQWIKLYESIKELLGNQECENLSDLDRSLRERVITFHKELDQPKVTLATAGTTSSGKSSLVNLLCGAEIMPVSNEEMSAGIVIIDHDPMQKWLRIPNVEGLPKDISGEWSSISDDEICERLTRAMDAYRELCNKNLETSAPRFELKYPIRMGSHAKDFGLPDNSSLRIVDLPGMKYANDDINLKLIASEATKALCLVAINSEETDDRKQDELMKEVESRVKDLHGSPARMLFLLNRIDAFIRDRKGEERKKAYIEKMTARIRNSIIEALPEYREQANEINIYPLSTIPALYAYQVLNNKYMAQKAFEEIRFTWGYIIPVEMRKNLDQPQKIAERIWELSYGKSFDETLKNHIKANLPQLLLPHLLKPVADIASKALIEADQIMNGYKNNTEIKYAETCKRLAQIREDLKKLDEFEQRNLKCMMEINADDPDITNSLMSIVRSLVDGYQLDSSQHDKLVPLYDWMPQLNKVVYIFMDSIIDSILKKESIPKGQLFELLPPNIRESLTQALSQIQKSGYLEYARDGGILKAVSPEEIEKLRCICQMLNDLSKVLSDAQTVLVNRTARQEERRIQEALKFFISVYAEYINRKSKEKAKELNALEIFPPELTESIENLDLSARLTITAIPVRGKETIFKGTKKEWRSVRDALGALCNLENPIYRTIKIYESKEYLSLSIPPLMSINEEYKRQLDNSCRYDVQPRFVNWLGTQIQNVSNDVDKYHKDLLDGYEQRLNEARNRVKEETDSNIMKWQIMSDEGNKLGKLAKSSLRYENMLKNPVDDNKNLNPVGV